MTDNHAEATHAAPRRILELPPEHAARPPLRLRDNVWVWAGAAVIVLACAAAVLSGTEAGALTLAGWLLVCGAVRLVLPEPGPAGLAIRSRYLDVAAFWVLAAAIGFLAVATPMI